MNGRHAICVVIDGLRASALGCYGNTVSRTPNFDDFASRSTVVEWLWADSPEIEGFYRSAWHGTHALRPAEFHKELPSLCSSLQEAGTPLRFITDEPSLAEQFVGDELVVIEQPTKETAATIVETAFAQFCGKAIEQLEDWYDDGSGSVTWIHSRGLLGAWDAPLELRSDLLDEDDPPALETVEPPEEFLSVEDPDQLLLYRTAYAAQVAVLDSCFGALWNAIEELMSDREALMMLSSASGFALGEHGHLGFGVRQLHSERLHLPWLLHLCDDSSLRPRISGLTQPADLHATLLDWLGIAAPAVSDGQSVLPALDSQPTVQRDLAVATGKNKDRALVTPAWMMRDDSERIEELFTKPDDRWEHNDVAVRCPHEIERLGDILRAFENSAQNGQPLPSSIKDQDLVRQVR